MPDGLFQICGKRAYTRLPPTWTGSCIIGIVQSGFFLLLNSQGEQLGVPLFETLGIRTKRSLSVGDDQRWGEDEWPSQRISETYWPDTWAQDGSWGYWTPIYMLNLLIRLQVVVEIITNQTASALELMARQQTQNACHYISKPSVLKLSSSWGMGHIWQIQPFKLLPSNWCQQTSG
jgi:hypothetical protein